MAQNDLACSCVANNLQFSILVGSQFAKVKADMILEISEEERTLLLELIESAEEAAIQSMDHADSRSFKSVLKTKLELLASAKQKIRGQGTEAA